jgi:hypothetical protein
MEITLEAPMSSEPLGLEGDMATTKVPKQAPKRASKAKLSETPSPRRIVMFNGPYNRRKPITIILHGKPVTVGYYDEHLMPPCEVDGKPIDLVRYITAVTRSARHTPLGFYCSVRCRGTAAVRRDRALHGVGEHRKRSKRRPTARRATRK